MSPILSNMMLHKLDVYISKKKEEIKLTNKERNGYKINPKYHSLSNKIYRLKKKALSYPKPLDKALTSEIKKAKKYRRAMKSLVYNTELTKIEYVRYADD